MSARGLVVSNTTPISHLIRIRQLPLLQRLFERVVIPTQVAEELEGGKHVLGVWSQAPGAEGLTVEQPLEGPFLHQLRTRLDAGEAAAIALALERRASLLLMDELDGRTVAQYHGIPLAGTLGVLLEAKRQHCLPEIRPLVEALEHAGFRMSAVLKQHVLATAGEA